MKHISNVMHKMSSQLWQCAVIKGSLKHTLMIITYSIFVSSSKVD